MQSRGKKNYRFSNQTTRFLAGKLPRLISHGVDRVPEVKVAKQQQHGRGVRKLAARQISLKRASFLDFAACLDHPPCPYVEIVCQ